MENKLKQKQIEEMAKYLLGRFDLILTTADAICISNHILKRYQPKLAENAVVLTREEVKIYQKIYDFMKEKGIVSVEEMKTLISFALKSSMLKSHIVKETAEKIMNDISSDILIVNTREYGNIEVVPMERLEEIFTNIIREN